MAWADVKPYFRSRLVANGLTKEHYDGFNLKNVPSSTLHNSYVIELTTIRGISNNQDCQTTECGVKVNIFRAGYRKPREAIDAAIAFAQTLVEDFIKAENRLNSGDVWTVYFDDIGVVPLDETDDNSLIIEMSFRALVILQTR